MKILICGTKGSGKSTLAEPFARLIGGVWINEAAVQEKYGSFPAMPQKLLFLAEGVEMTGNIAVIDYTCAKAHQRDILKADYIVWMDAVERGVDFEPLSEYNYHVAKWFDDTHKELARWVKSWMEYNESKG